MRLPRLFHNRLSYVGAVIAILSLIAFVFLFVVHTLTGAGRLPYAGVVILVLVPAVLIFGLLLIPVGMFFEWRRWRRSGERPMPKYPRIDLNNPRHRTAMVIFVLGSVFLLFASTFGSYEAYQFTDSVQFCGLLCHRVMAPEYTTYLASPHARVSCAQCHVGPGASWFVRSKLAGLHQVYAVLFNKYPRPISTPIHNLRPAQVTCEQCHWPEQFFGAQQKKLVHFLPDEHNTEWVVNLLIKTGGGSPTTGQTEGIHWHMNIANRVEYIATDEKRQDIPWVRMTNVETGETTEYMSTDEPLSKEEIAKGTIRQMDCMDCHNRPTHILRSPSYSVNLALETGKIDSSLPWIKRNGVELLAASYSSTDSALEAITEGVRQFYKRNYRSLTNDNKAAISRAITALQDIYRQNFFPDMKSRWDVYPDNIGHLNSLGCFRCHDGSHKSADGRVIPRECSTCHSIMQQGKVGSNTFSMRPQGLPFRHPEDIDQAWKEMNCSDCHTGELP